EVQRRELPGGEAQLRTGGTQQIIEQLSRKRANGHQVHLSGGGDRAWLPIRRHRDQGGQRHADERTPRATHRDGHHADDSTRASFIPNCEMCYRSLMNATARVADFVAKSRWEDCPEAAVIAARHAILDCLGVMLAGSAEPCARILQSIAAAE